MDPSLFICSFVSLLPKHEKYRVRFERPSALERNVLVARRKRNSTSMDLKKRQKGEVEREDLFFFISLLIGRGFEGMDSMREIGADETQRWFIDALVRMLNLNQTVSTLHGEGDDYKVLILDAYCRDVITPLLRVNELRRLGVTLHLMIDVEREAISDAPAVYFVRPTRDNVMRIVKDAERDLYESMHINFAGIVPEDLMDLLAEEAVRGGCSHKIKKVYDQFANFVSLEHRLFSLGQESSFVVLNDPGANPEVRAFVRAVRQNPRVID